MQSKHWSGGLALVLLAICAPAAATLGEDVASVPADQVRMQATLQTENAAGFAVQRLLLPSGASVSEYVSSSGMVFAVSWQGPELPDLQQLLGRYFEAYVEAVKSRASGGARSVQQRGLVVQTGGHMRAYYGRVYVPAMLPRGVAEEQIQ